MKKYMLTFNLLLHLVFASSQNYVDLLKVSGGTTPFNKFDTSNSKTKINEFSADLTIPVKINSRLSLISGVIYENMEVKLFADDQAKRFGSTAVKAGINAQWNDHWSVTAVVLPKISSDYVALSQKDFQLGGIGFMKYKKRDNLIYKFGLYFNSELFGPFFVPMAGLYYLSTNKKFEANLMLPLQADIAYKIHPVVNFGLSYNGQMRSYHLTDIKAGHRSTYLAKSTNEFYLYLKFNVSESLSMQTRVGHSIARHYRVYDDNDKVTFGLPATFIGDKRQQLNSDFSNGLILQASLLYRFNLDKK